MNRYAIIVAGGKGLRMGAELPKQFISIGERPILMHTLNAFHKADAGIHLILVLPKEQFSYWNALCELHCFKLELKIVEGGATRFHSVKNGLKAVQEDSSDLSKTLVAVHDGVRPFVSQQVIMDAFKAAAEFGGVVPVVDMVDSVRKIQSGHTSHPVDRDSLKLVQTPQVFKADRLIESYSVAYDKSFTDDASVYESAGNSIRCITGNRENIKITTPFDLLVAEALIV